MKKNNKGFTLVELIVVLVILAILAAILVPALLGYIDKAREGQYAEEAHSILTAAQGYCTEQYAKDPAGTVDLTTDAAKTYINNIVGPDTVVDKISDVSWTGTTDRQKHTIKGMTVKFKSQDGKTGTMTFDGSNWTIDAAGFSTSNASSTPATGGENP
ncbi:MAG: type II secretion system GspH family protein [Eubacterium sp.]|nr:type II secretion system GspH family protein [Eubacterium sp.]